METTLLILLFVSHFLGDYTHLSTNWMLNAKRLGKPVLPILVHAGVHAILIGIVLSFFVSIKTPLFWNLVLFELYTHFLIDVLKGRMNGWFPSLQNPANKFFWYIFGADQLAHSIVIIIIVKFAC